MKWGMLVLVLVVMMCVATYFYFLGHQETVRTTYTPEQREAINWGRARYSELKANGTEFSSQCLGNYGDYAIDIVHVPRTSEDDLPENQCEAYRNGSVKHFIELDVNGTLVRIV